MDIISHFRNIQNLLLCLHKELLKIADSNRNFSEIDYEENLLKYLVNELKKYDMFSQFEVMSPDCRRKELILLLTKKLGVKLRGRSFSEIEKFSNCNSNCEYLVHEAKKIPCFTKSTLKIPLNEIKNLNSCYFEYQLYSNILRRIQRELIGIANINKDPLVNTLLIGLCIKLQQRDCIQLLNLSSTQKREKLLKILAAKLTEKCNQITLKDMIQNNTSGKNNVNKQVNNNPCKIWEELINEGPNQELMKTLFNKYPLCVSEMFVQYVSEAKENIVLEHEKLFQAKINLLKKEALNNIESIKKQLQNRKQIHAYLKDYSEHLKSNYNSAESEFYRQEILKSNINDLAAEIDEIKVRANLRLAQIFKDIKMKETCINNLSDTLGCFDCEYYV